VTATFRLPEKDRARGLMAGLLLGDALGREDAEVPGLLHGTSLAQLACFTVEGLVRASVRAAHKGTCHPAEVVWHAYHRWGAIQRVVPHAGRPYAGGSTFWPDGWLHQVAPLAVARGATAATTAALRAGVRGTPGHPVGTAADAHALTRTLPAALFASTMSDAGQLARELAVLTHGAPAARETAATGTVLVARALQEDTLDAVLGDAPAPPGGLRGTAAAALAHGLAAARAHPAPDEVLAAIAAAGATGGAGAATCVGTLLGALHGYRALPQPLLARLEIGWVADRLAVDAVVEQSFHPSRSSSATGDGSWYARYPGW